MQNHLFHNQPPHPPQSCLQEQVHQIAQPTDRGQHALPEEEDQRQQARQAPPNCPALRMRVQESTDGGTAVE